MYAKDKVAIVDRREMLRVKVKSLAEEARIIRREEQRSWGPLRNELHAHRVRALRQAARQAHLAYGLIRGRTIGQMENRRWIDLPSVDREAIIKMLKKYGPATGVVYDVLEPLKAA